MWKVGGEIDANDSGGPSSSTIIYFTFEHNPKQDKAMEAPPRFMSTKYNAPSKK
jgi:hypothetical protein